MSKKLVYFFALLGAMVVFAPACGDSDPCKDVDCGVNGTCFEGVCVCNVGYEGDACAEEWATKFLGSYLGSDVCGGTTYNLSKPAVITRISESKIQIANFGGFDSILQADVKLASSSDITAEQIEYNYTDPTGRKFVGSGQINGNTLTGTYTVTYSDGTSETCTFNYTK
ncbi:MAG: hypothetical protein IPM81_15560 [Saprospirales bacterium]|jgi:hypothetical protein|nr:hypothetical protein [Saprospirales bacterium]